MRLLLVRHPACDVPAGHCYGRLDAGLSAAGRRALPSLLARLGAAAIPAVISSPARRCRAVAAGLDPAHAVDDRLAELDFGHWEGRPWEAIGRDALDRWAADPLGFAPPGGETGAALLARVAAVAADLRADGRDRIVVTHGGPLRLLPALLRGEAVDLLAPAPPLGGVLELHVQASADSPAHSATAAQPPSTSPVKPPI